MAQFDQYFVLFPDRCHSARDRWLPQREVKFQGKKF